MNNELSFWKDCAWKTGVVVGGIAGLLLLVLAIQSITSIVQANRNYPPTNVISVQGRGEVIAIPDVAVFSFSVIESGKTVVEAQDKSTKITNDAIATLKKSGVDDKDIKTTGYNINPKYEYQQGVCDAIRCQPSKQVLLGYEVSQSVDIKVRDLAKAGSLLTSMGTVGVKNLSGLSFRIDDEEKFKAEARAIAIADAKTKADALSKNLNVSIKRMVGFYEENQDMYNPMFYGKGGDMAAASESTRANPNLPTGEQKIVVQVNLSYEMR